MTPAELREREQQAEEAAEQTGEKAPQMEATAGGGSSATRGATGVAYTAGNIRRGNARAD